MNRTLIIIFALILLAGCRNKNSTAGRIPVAEVGNVKLYYDEIPQLIQHGINETDSVAIVQNYINKWAKRRLLLQKAE
jgi:hypothetical protein